MLSMALLDFKLPVLLLCRFLSVSLALSKCGVAASESRVRGFAWVVFEPQILGVNVPSMLFVACIDLCKFPRYLKKLLVCSTLS